MNFSEAFVVGEMVELLFFFRSMNIVLHNFLEGIHYRMVLLLGGVVEDVEKYCHLMRKMIPEEHELLVVIADFHLQSLDQPVFWLFFPHLGSIRLDSHPNCYFLQTGLELIRLNLKCQTPEY